MSSNMFHLPLVRGCAVPSVGSARPWAPAVSGAGNASVPAQASGPVQAFGGPAATERSAKIAERRRMSAATPRPLAVKAELPLIDTRKQYVHMTRVAAGGDGAMGPQPEREPV